MKPPRTATRRNGRRLLIPLLAITVTLSGCASSSNRPAALKLAANQILNIGYPSDPQSLDPAQVGNYCVPDPIVDNVFDGLYRIDARLQEVPDLAAGAPQISSNGTVYTFHLRAGVRFSNGDSLTARDVQYSWTRSVLAFAKSGASLDDFWPIAGYDDLAAGRAAVLRGLTVVDDETLRVTLSHPAAHWFPELVLASYRVVDQRAVEAHGDATWWQTPDGLIGSGPFRMSARTPGHSMDFEPVNHWWGGSAGTLTHVHVQVAGSTLAAAFQNGQVDYVAASGTSCDENGTGFVNHFLHDLPGWAGDVHFSPPDGAVYAGIGRVGVLAGESGKLGRIALSEAIDRQLLAHRTLVGAIAATGGPIPKGLDGYLGDNADPWAAFNPSQGRADYRKWDPTGSKAAGISYLYNSKPYNDAVARALQAQWQANLGITVKLKPVDGPTFFGTSAHGNYSLARLGWSGDYNAPQDWFTKGALNPPAPYSNQALLADAQPGPASIAAFQSLSRNLANDAVVISLAYLSKPWLARPYVYGAGETAFSELPWTGVHILAH